MIVVGLDLSTTSTGLVRIQLGEEPPMVGIHRIRSAKSKSVPKGEQPSIRQRHDRLQVIEDQIAALVGELPRGVRGIARYPDLLVVEGPSFASTGFTQHDLSGNWWRVVRRILRHDIPVADVSPSQVKKYATGSGGSQVSKTDVIAAVLKRYPDHADQVTGDDTADALVLAAIGCRHLGYPLEASLPAAHLAAMDKIRWPERTLV